MIDDNWGADECSTTQSIDADFFVLHFWSGMGQMR